MNFKMFVFLLGLSAMFGSISAYAQEEQDLLPPPLPSSLEVASKPVVEYLPEQDLEKLFEDAHRNFGQDFGELKGELPVNNIQEDIKVEDAKPTVIPEPTAIVKKDEVDSAAPKPAIVKKAEQPKARQLDKKQDVKMVRGRNIKQDFISLGDVRVNVSLENITLEEVISSVVSKAEKQTGPWKVRWRLKDENQVLRHERVNINAESDFETFMANLMAKVNNTTGTKLFIKVFETSRIIIIADNF